MKRSRGIFALYFFSFYVAAYCVLFHFRRPAANLAYWGYTEDCPEWIETCTYYFFYPIYFVHQRVFHGHRHTWDRLPIHLPGPDFQG